MPGQDGALDPRREFVDTGKNFEFAHLANHPAGHDHFMDLVENLLHLGLGFAFDALGQQRGGGLGDAAAGADEADVLDDIAFGQQEEFQLVAAERVMALGGSGGAAQLVEIARVFAVVQDDLLI